MAAIAFTPNTEQAVALASTAHRLLVRAKAGTGKTALLIEHARRNSHLRLLYVTFGKANQEDAAARFPQNVTTKTSHGLAWEVVGGAVPRLRGGHSAPGHQHPVGCGLIPGPAGATAGANSNSKA